MGTRSDPETDSEVTRHTVLGATAPARHLTPFRIGSSRDFLRIIFPTSKEIFKLGQIVLINPDKGSFIIDITID